MQNVSSLAARLENLLQSLDDLHSELIAQEALYLHELSQISPDNRESAVNLLHYLTLRRRDVRPLQYELSDLGLSSLGRSESNVLHSVESIRAVVATLAGSDDLDRTPSKTPIPSTGRKRLRSNAEHLLGRPPAKRDVRIMVTMPAEAGTDPRLVHDMVASGMNCMRINCAHDDQQVWSRMIANLRRAEAELDCKCMVMMDLGGPKLRTGPIEPGPRVMKIRPERDDFGRVTKPARVWLRPDDDHGSPAIPGAVAIPLPSEWLSRIESGDVVTFADARGARRSLAVTDRAGLGCWAEISDTTFLTPGITLHRRGDDPGTRARVGDLPEKQGFITLKSSDLLDLTRSLAPGRGTRFDELGRLVAPACIGCTLPEVFEAAKPGEPIWFDDGKIGGVIVDATKQNIRVKISQAGTKGSKLRAEKGINLPESRLRVPALTSKDREDLEFIAKNADMVALSFVTDGEDVVELQQCLTGHGKPEIGIVLKIETKRGFENLPEMLLAVMRSPNAGIMIARGDLAIECGYERLAEVQEEILWISEAAHLPVIWATQVLETLARTGTPSRSEITDAAMGQRAECIMLNKGPYVIDAIRLLDGILERMQSHQSKKRSLLRQLRSRTKKPAFVSATTNHQVNETQKAGE